MFKIESNLERIIWDYYRTPNFLKNPTAYFYDLSAVSSNLERLQRYLPKQVRLYYSMKANNHPRVMELVCNHAHVSGTEIASYGEMKQALVYHPGSRIIFTGPGKTEFELEEAVKAGIELINVESVTEAVRINNIAKRCHIPKVNILLRINLNYSIIGAFEQMSGQSTKMGIDEDQCMDSLRFIQGLDRICVQGIHVFAASGVLDYESLLKSNEYIFRLASRIEREIGHLAVIDLGGGLGIDYTDADREFDLEKYARGLKQLISDFNFTDKEIIMELGTYVVGNAGYYTAKILDIKRIKGKSHIIIAGGVNHMGLPLEMQRKHPVGIVPMNDVCLYEGQPHISKETVDISGPLCMVSDRLCWDEYIEKAEIGDIVVFSQAGAYCLEEGMHDFLSHFMPHEIIIRNENSEEVPRE